MNTLGGAMSPAKTHTRIQQRLNQRGFSLLQLCITLAVVAIVSALAVYGIASARQRIRLTNSARLLASYLEKARVDSVRRHAAGAGMSGITFLTDRTYQVRMDFDGDGIVETRDVSLEDGVVVANNLPSPISFDWRGKLDGLPDNKISITLQYGSDQRSIDVTRSGDVTIDSREYLDDVPEVNVNVNNANTGIDEDSTLNGNASPHPSPTVAPTPTPSPSPSPSPSSNPSPSPAPSVSPTPDGNPSASPSVSPTPGSEPSPSISPTPCVATASPTALSIQKNGPIGTIDWTVSSGLVSFSSGPSNLKVTQVSTNHFTVQSTNTSRGDFTLVFSTPCGSKDYIVTVTN
jgi:Tfp pilus assembly protein FimT